MKKILFISFSIVFGFLGIGMLSMTINPITSSELPSSLLTIYALLGVGCIFAMRFFWKKFKKL